MTNHLPSMRLAIAVALSFVVSSPSMGRLAAAEGVEQLQERSRESRAEERPAHDALRAEIRRLQESLGGPQVDRFPSLRAQGFSVPGASGRSRAGQSSIPREAIRALRDAAAQLDVTANRLEQLDLFTQADALRQQAQRLRVDARGMSGVHLMPTPEPTPGPRPAAWGEPQLNSQPLWNETPPPPHDEPAPPRSSPAPELEPVPQPDIPSDPPNPQPLLDSPEATPQPDVEVEG